MQPTDIDAHGQRALERAEREVVSALVVLVVVAGVFWLNRCWQVSLAQPEPASVAADPAATEPAPIAR